MIKILFYLAAMIAAYILITNAVGDYMRSLSISQGNIQVAGDSEVTNPVSATNQAIDDYFQGSN